MYSPIKNLVIVSTACILVGCSQPDRSGYQTTGKVRTTKGESVAARPAAPQPARAEPAPKAAPAPRQSPARPVQEVPQRRTRLASTDDANVYPNGAGYNISFEDLREHVENGTAVIIDARSAEQFAQGHVRGAINIPAGEAEAYTQRYLQDVDRGQFMIIYCSSATCHASDMLYEYLQTQGFVNMRVFNQGWVTLAHAKSLL